MNKLIANTARIIAALVVCATVSACTAPTSHSEFPSYGGLGTTTQVAPTMSIMDY
jgi:hypothetical protein